MADSALSLKSRARDQRILFGYFEVFLFIHGRALELLIDLISESTILQYNLAATVDWENLQRGWMGFVGLP